MRYKKRSPGVAAPRLQESKKCLATLSRFGANSTPNQGIFEQYIFVRYNEALAIAEADPARENLESWGYWHRLLPPGFIRKQRS
jgi:hypothetical protein